jgi:hypothetical protein
MFKKVYDSMRDSMKKSSAWISIAEGTYTKQRDRVLG